MKEFEAFILAICEASRSWMSTFKKIADDVGVPYLEHRQGNGRRGPRIIEEFGSGFSSRPGDFLPGESDNSPSCCLDVPKALRKLHGQRLRGMYFHGPTLCLVLVTDYDLIGIRSTTLRKGCVQLSVELYENRKKLNDSIRVRAHEIWEERGCPEGSSDEIWLEAENQINPKPDFNEWCIKEGMS